MPCRLSAASLSMLSAFNLMDTVQRVLTLLVADLVISMLVISTVVDEVRAHDISAFSLPLFLREVMYQSTRES
jgi:hypothetical protein